MVVAVLASGCVQGFPAAPDVGLHSPAEDRGIAPDTQGGAGTIPIVPGDWYVLVAVAKEAASRVGLEATFAESSRDHVLGLALYDLVGGEYDWAVGVTGASKSASVGSGTDTAVVLVVVHAATPTSIDIKAVADDAPIPLNILSTGAAQISYYVDEAWATDPLAPPSAHHVNASGRPIDSPPGTMIGELDIETDHVAAERSLTWSFVVVRSTAGIAPHELTWSRFGKESTRAAPAAGPAISFVGIQTETGEGSTGLSSKATGASALPATMLHHWTIPLGPALDGLAFRAKDDIGAPMLPAPTCVVGDGWICTAPDR